MSANVHELGQARPAGDAGKRGVTLVEAVIAVAIAATLCIALVSVGLKSQELAETSRMATEARALAKERLVEMLGLGYANLAMPSCTLLGTDTCISTLGYDVVRRAEMIWHDGDGAVVPVEGAAYGEAVVRVTYPAPVGRRTLTDSYTTLIHNPATARSSGGGGS